MSEKRRYSFKRIFGNLLWALLGLALVVLLGAAISLKKNKHCKGVSITISGIQKNFFIDKKEIGSIVESFCGGGLHGKTISSINLAAIENTLKKNQWIKNAELFFDNNDVLRVEVIEREPVARIFTNTGVSFYLDTDLMRLPLSDKSTARVPIFSNFPVPANKLTKTDSNFLNDVKNISSYILNDAFWMAQIEQVDITYDRNFVMIPKVGNQIIVFGNADNYEEKFNNLLTFYTQVATKVGWNKYSKINVQYKGQVVAVKRGAQDVFMDSLRTKQLMESLVVNAQNQANDSIKNIQLEQLPDDNTIPVAPQVDDMPDEQTITNDPISNQNPDIKNIIEEKKIPGSTEKIAGPKSNPVKKPTSSTGKPLSNEKSNPPKKDFVLKPGTKTITNSATKQINKTETKPKAVMPKKIHTQQKNIQL